MHARDKPELKGLRNERPQTLRRHSNKSRHDFVAQSPAWAQEHFSNPLPLSPVHLYMYKCKLKLLGKRITI